MRVQIFHQLERNVELSNHQFFSELITTQLRISHGVTANSLYLSSSPCEATNIIQIFLPIYLPFAVAKALSWGEEGAWRPVAD